MIWEAVAVVGAIVVGARLLWPSRLDHDETIQRTYDILEKNVPTDATVYADHIADGPNPRGELDGVNHVPDVIVKSRRANCLIIEVETAASLSANYSKARTQVQGLRKRGYRRVLLVPSGETTSDPVRSFVEEFDSLDGELYLATPDSVCNLL